MHLSLQLGKKTALMIASKAGHMGCVKALLDSGAEVNMQSWVSSVIIICVYAMQHVPGVPSVNQDMHRSLLCAYMYVSCR